MLRRFWVSHEDVGKDRVMFRDDSFHHLVTVSRKKVGDRVNEVDGSGFAFEVEILSVEKKKAEGQILGRRALPTLEKPHVHLAFCFPKVQNFELVLEKAVELGCASITPILSDYSSVRSVADFPEKKSERWRRIVQAATEQTGRADLLRIHPVTGLVDFADQINRDPKKKCLFLYEGECPLDLKTALQGAQFNQDDEVWALVGSEGGFSVAEVSALKERGFLPVTLGQQILRTETACVSILCVLKYELGQFR